VHLDQWDRPDLSDEAQSGTRSAAPVCRPDRRTTMATAARTVIAPRA
jgi:hypothetical protein